MLLTHVPLRHRSDRARVMPLQDALLRSDCQKGVEKGGHDQLCKDHKKSRGGAEQYNARRGTRRPSPVAAKAYAHERPGVHDARPIHWKTKEGLVRVPTLTAASRIEVSCGAGEGFWSRRAEENNKAPPEVVGTSCSCEQKNTMVSTRARWAGWSLRSSINEARR